jgi:hypothetical protein
MSAIVGGCDKSEEIPTEEIQEKKIERTIWMCPIPYVSGSII